MFLSELNIRVWFLYLSQRKVNLKETGIGKYVVILN